MCPSADAVSSSGECGCGWSIFGFDPTTASLVRVGTHIDSIYHENNKNFQPRVGFAWTPFRTGKTAYERLAGTGLGFNSNYAPVSIGPDGTAYVGVLGGLVLFREG